MKDESLEDTTKQPLTDEIAAEIAGEMQVALDEAAVIAEDLGKG